MKDKILGVLYGMAIGDAMGMPAELWSRKRVVEKYGKIQDFLDGDLENEISYQYKRGNFTDDTSQALTILDSLMETDFIPDATNIARHILEWAKKENAFENNILGPTSKVTLELFEQGKNARQYSEQALS
ncbi:MAG: ADP-ribosylglycohydrolase family protein, partial [Eubacterium sp.]|nr:ADP-ribosylglycohydrolase family protein [Eubacterium sp.]